MSTVAPVRICPICDQALENQAERCPGCSADDAWMELADGYGFCLRRFEEWHGAGRITTGQWNRLQAHYQDGRERLRDAARTGQPVWTGMGLPPKDQCWSCREYDDTLEPRCPSCGVIAQSPGVRSLRYWKLLSREVQMHQDTGRLSLVQAHEFDGEVRERMAALRGRLGQDRVRPGPKPRKPKVVVPSRSILEILLDPQTIQWLLASGGALLVIGLIIWLTSLGVFAHKETVAVALGLGNLLVLAGGFALIRFTRFQIAGRSLALLACLVMPLNLWFYHASQLIMVQDNLWIAALVCCAIYAASALVLRDHLFVYVMCAGIALTGLLLLADMGRFQEILAPSALLIILGLAALHLERAFPDVEGPFARKRFGMAFFWSAQALLASGLLLLLGGQIISWLPIWERLGMPQPPLVGNREYMSYTLLLTLAGTYAYLWSDLVVRRVGIYIAFVAITLLWAEVQLLVLLGIAATAPIVIITLALTALAINLLQVSIGFEHAYTRVVPPLGLVLSFVPVVYGILLHLRATNVAFKDVWPFDITWEHVGAMVVTALACRAEAYLYRRTMPWLSAVYFFATAAATLVAAASLLWMIDLKPWQTQAPLLMIIPVIYLVASRLYRGHSPEEPLFWVAHASTVVMMVCSLYAFFINARGAEILGFQLVTGATQNLLYALFCAEAAVFYVLAASFRKETWNVYLATLMFCAALWQLLIYWQTPQEYYTVAFAVSGAALLVVYRLAVLENTTWSGLATAAFQSANGLLSLGFLSGALLTLSRLAMSQTELDRLAGGAELWRQPIRNLIFVLILLGLLSLMACLLVRHTGWRRFYVVLAVVDALLIFACVHKISMLSPWQKLEIFTLVLGGLLLVIGMIGWYRENERQNDLVSFSLLFGSIMLTMPLILAILRHRFGPNTYVSWPDELGLILVGVVLTGLGIVCRLKSTTLLGGAALGVYVLIVIASLYRFLDESWIIGISLAVGGGVLFGVGLFLSMYRDQLLTLPDRIKRREGVFKILSWR